MAGDQWAWAPGTVVHMQQASAGTGHCHAFVVTVYWWLLAVNGNWQALGTNKHRGISKHHWALPGVGITRHHWETTDTRHHLQFYIPYIIGMVVHVYFQNCYLPLIPFSKGTIKPICYFYSVPPRVLKSFQPSCWLLATFRRPCSHLNLRSCAKALVQNDSCKTNHCD